MSKNISSEKTVNEDVYKNIFIASHDAIVTLEAPSWRFTSGNPAATQMFGAKDEVDFLSYEPWKLSSETQPDGQPSGGKAKAMIEKAMQEGSNFFEWTHRRVDGEDFPVEVALETMRENNNYAGTDNVTLQGSVCTYTVTNTGGTTRSITVSEVVRDITRKLLITTSTFNPLVIASW